MYVYTHTHIYIKHLNHNVLLSILKEFAITWALLLHVNDNLKVLEATLKEFVIVEPVTIDVLVILLLVFSKTFIFFPPRSSKDTCSSGIWIITLLISRLKLLGLFSFWEILQLFLCICAFPWLLDLPHTLTCMCICVVIPEHATYMGTIWASPLWA